MAVGIVLYPSGVCLSFQANRAIFVLIHTQKLMAQRILESVVWKEGKYFVAQCLNIDISSFGESRDEALTNLDEAINLYLEDDSHQDIQSIENPEIVHLSIKYA